MANQEEECCRRFSLGVKCLCKFSYYKIKPFALQFLKSISQFFELVAFAILPPYQLKQIIRELDSKIKFRKERQYLFAHVIYDPKYFVRINNETVFNMLLLTKHRKKDEMFLMS